MSELLDQLNEPQREAAACTEGPVMIIAGAGSGKTRTLTYRIAHLIELGVDPFSILALTFTNKAAAEMKERIMKLVGSEARNIWMGTFHSVFARILRSEAQKLGYINTFTIYDNDDSKSVIKQIVKDLKLDDPKKYSPGTVLNRISMAKSNLLGPEDYMNNPEIQQTDNDAQRPLIGEIYKMYNQRLRNAMAMDFDDLLFNMNVLLRDFPDVLLKYQNRFKYIMVDEYQDTNFSQYCIVKKLAARYQNICVVGDDAQSIYAFRGANIQNIFNFRRDYPNLNLFKLEQNYRSTKMIVDAANSIIAKNVEQIEKEIWTDNAVGNLIRLLRAADEREEGNLVADSIQKAHIGEGLPYKSFAILYRTNVQSRAIEEALRRADIPYRIYQGISFYGRKEIKDVLAYLRLVVNNYDDESLIRIINYPARGIGNTTLDRIRVAAADNDVAIWTVLENLPSFGLGLSSGTLQRITDFVMMIKLFSSMLQTTNAYDLAKQVVYASRIIALLEEDKDDPDNRERVENIKEMLNGVKEFCEKDDQFSEIENELPHPDNSQFKTLDQFLQQVLLLTSEDKDDDKESDKVSMMTIHAAKGLEFPYVYVMGLEENLFPSSLSLFSRQELEEERRLFYVAVTRAEKQLVLSYALTRYQYGKSSCQEMSRFVEEIDSKYIELPRRQKSFPNVGELPRAFQGVKGIKFSPEAEQGFAQPASQPKSKNLKPIAKASATHKGPTAQNTAETINAIQPGMTVRHDKFGTGKVLSCEGAGKDRKAVVFFEGIGQKTLLLAFAKLIIIE
ncbi:MAG: UvrD-helicase domain-containing protein [Bacteroidales bacterium]|nr:UvrD-helicase domain-containing protein [Bacteroidales bacterium]